MIYHNTTVRLCFLRPWGIRKQEVPVWCTSDTPAFGCLRLFWYNGKMFRDEQSWWNFLFTLLYMALLAGGAWLLWAAGRMPVGITFFDAALITLASFRLTRLFVYDKVTGFFRDWFLDIGVGTGESGELVLVRERPVRGPRRTLTELVGCPWCLGLWLTTVVVFAFYATPYAWLPILVFALAGVVSLLQLLANFLGWRAESAKQEAGGIDTH